MDKMYDCTPLMASCVVKVEFVPWDRAAMSCQSMTLRALNHLTGIFRYATAVECLEIYFWARSRPGGSLKFGSWKVYRGHIATNS